MDNVNIEISKIITKVLMNTGFSNNPDAMLYIINEIKKNRILIESYSINPREFVKKISDERFLTMLYNNYMKLIKEKSNNVVEEDRSDLKSNITSSPNNNIDNRKKFDWLYKDSDNSENVQKESFNNDSKVVNILPDIDEVYMLKYDVTLDLLNDLIIDDFEKLNEECIYKLQFTQYGNVSKVQLLSFTLPYNEYIKNLPYIYVKISEINGKCYDSSRNCFFGKLILNKYDNDNMYYISDYNSCVQVFSYPIELNKLSISFFDNKNNILNLQEIKLNEVTPSKNKCIIKTLYKHNLKENEVIVIYLLHDNCIDVIDTSVKSVISENEIEIDMIKKDIPNSVEMYRRYLKSNITFRFNEININLLSGKDKTNLHLVQLNNLVNSIKK